MKPFFKMLISYYQLNICNYLEHSRWRKDSAVRLSIKYVWLIHSVISCMIIKKMCSHSYVTNWQLFITKQKLSFQIKKINWFLTGTNCFSRNPFFFFFFSCSRWNLIWLLSFTIVFKAKSTHTEKKRKQTDQHSKDNSVRNIFCYLPLVNATETITAGKDDRGGNSKAMFEQTS